MLIKEKKCVQKTIFSSLKLIIGTRHQKLVKISKQHVIYSAKILWGTECVVEWGGLTQQLAAATWCKYSPRLPSIDIVLRGTILTSSSKHARYSPSQHCILTSDSMHLPSRHICWEWELTKFSSDILSWCAIN